MEYSGGKMMETNDDLSMPFPMTVVKEERLDFDEMLVFHDETQEEKKGETIRRGRTRSLSKKSADKIDIKAKLERSRQSARECRARKKLRYQYLEEIISETEKSIVALRRELDCLKIWAKELDDGRVPPGLMEYRRTFVERKLPDSYRFTAADVLMEERVIGPEILRHAQAVAAAASSPASSGIASVSTSVGNTMAFSPTSSASAFAAMMLNPSSLTHTISPS